MLALILCVTGDACIGLEQVFSQQSVHVLQIPQYLTNPQTFVGSIHVCEFTISFEFSRILQIGVKDYVSAQFERLFLR